MPVRTPASLVPSGVRVLVLFAVGCGATRVPASSAITVDGERIAAIAPDAHVWPPIVDSHVHLALDPVADQLAANGVLVAVDLAAPERTLGAVDRPVPIRLLEAGPMLTHSGGYPLDAWGADGYGAGCDDAACVAATIDRLAAKGARVIKIALDDDGLAPELVPGAVAAAHAHHLKVAVHALTAAGAALGARAGADVLAHTPLEPLPDATVEAWRGRAVISTLAAFDGRGVENLQRLRAHGVTVLYGTDLGNLQATGPSREELALLRAAGLDDAAIAAAMTTVPLAYWGQDGRVTPGHEATLLVLDGDPSRDASLLLAPREVWQRGCRVR
jgi:hypothetical protein